MIEMLVVLAIIGLLVGLTLAAVQQVRMAAARAQCQANLRQIGIGLHGYHDAYGAFPPGVGFRGEGDPYYCMNWHTRILPFVEQTPLWKQAQQAYAQTILFNQNPPHTPLTVIVKLYTCPIDRRTAVIGGGRYGGPAAFTDYLGVRASSGERKDGVLFLGSHVSLTDITDGSSNTLLVGERPPLTERSLGWWYAGVGVDGGGTADGVLAAKERNTYPILPECPFGPYNYGPGRLDYPCDSLHFWSQHPGGANFLFADGSVHFLPYSAASILPALASRNGGEAVSPPN